MPAVTTVPSSSGGRAARTWVSTSWRSRLRACRLFSRPDSSNSLIFIDFFTFRAGGFCPVGGKSVLNFLVLTDLILHSLPPLLARPRNPRAHDRIQFHMNVIFVGRKSGRVKQL